MKYIKKYNESLSQLGSDELKDYFIDIYDNYDTEIEVYNKDEYLKSEEVLRGNIDGNMHSFLEEFNFIFTFQIKPDVYDYTNQRTEYSLVGTIESYEHNNSLLSFVKKKFDSLTSDYKFYIKDYYKCYFFFNI
jgi:hypothetical protein